MSAPRDPSSAYREGPHSKITRTPHQLTGTLGQLTKEETQVPEEVMSGKRLKFDL